MEIYKSLWIWFAIIAVKTPSVALLNKTETDDSHYWNVPSLSKVAIAVVRGILGSKKEIIKETLLAINEPMFEWILHVVKQCLRSQKRLAVFSAIGCILTFMVTFTSLFVYFFGMRVGRCMKPKKHSISRKKDPSKVIVNRVTSTLVIIGIFFSVALVILGSALIFIGAKSMEKVNSEIFDLINSSVTSIYVMKSGLMHNMRSVPEERRRLTDASMRKLLRWRENLATKFRKAIFPETNKILQKTSYLQGSIRHLDYANGRQLIMLNETRDISKHLETQLRDVYESIDGDTTTGSDETKVLKEKFEILANAKISTFLDSAIDVNEKGSPILRYMVRNFHLNMASKTLWSLFNIPATLEIDPTRAIKNIRKAGMRLFQGAVMEMDSSFVFLNWILPEEAEQNVILKLQDKKTKANSIINYLWRFFMYTEVVASSTIFPIGVATVLGVIGTNFFEKLDENGYRRNLLSNSAGNILEAGLYVASIFLWIYWFLSSLLLVMTAVPVNVCSAFESREITELKFSHFRNESNSSVSENHLDLPVSYYVRPCEEEIGTSQAYVEKLQKMFENVSFFRDPIAREAIEKSVGIHVAEIPLLNDSGIIEDAIELQSEYIQIHGFVKEYALELSHLQGYLSAIEIYINQMLNNTNLTASSRNYTSFIRQKCKQLQEIVEELVGRVEEKSEELPSWQIREKDVKRVQKNAVVLADVSNKFNFFLRNKVKSILVESLENVSADFVHGLVFSQMQVMRQFDRIGCHVLWSMYQRLTNFICHRYLSSIASLWLGETLVAIFLLSAIMAGVPATWLFKFPDQRKETALEEIDHIETDYVSRRRGTSYDMLMSSIIKRGSFAEIPDGQQRELSHKRTDSLLTSITEEESTKNP